MKKVLYLMTIVLLCFQAKAQLTANFASSTGASLPIPNCGNLIVSLTNTSVGTYDTAKWEIYRSTSSSCGTGTTLITSYSFYGAVKTNNAAVPALPLGLSTTYYYVCLTVSNTLGQKSKFCNCVAKIFPIPQACFTASDTLACQTITTNLVPCDPGSIPPYTFTWNVGSGYNPSGGSPYSTQTNTFAGGPPNPTTGNLWVKYFCNSSRQGIYMQVKDANGCQSAVIKSDYINVVCNPQASFTSSGSLCSPGPVTLTANPNLASYTWWIPANSSTAIGPSAINTLTQGFPSYGCTDIKLAVYKYVNPTFGCVDTVTQTNAVCIQGIANTSTLSVSPTSVSSGQQFTITFTGCTNPPPSGSLSSAISGTIVSSVCSPAPCVTGQTLGTITSVGCTPGTLNASISLPPCNTVPVTYCLGFQNGNIINMLNNCSGTFNNIVNITVNPAPSANITLASGYVSTYCTQSHQFCFDGPTQNIAPNLPGATYEWYTVNPSSPGAVVLGTGQSFCTNFSNYGPHDVYLKVTQSASNGGASAVGTYQVSLNPLTGRFTYNRNSGCDTVSVYFSGSSWPQIDTLYKWEFGDGTSYTSTDSFVTHTYSSNVDTCFTVKMIHRNHYSGGSYCIDTVMQKGIIRIGHKIPPVVNLSNNTVCLVGGKACITINPDPIMNVVPVPGSYISLCSTKSCKWYFTRPHKTAILLQSTLCDSPKVCFTDTGVYSAHYVISNNGCNDTLTIDSILTVNGIKSDFKDSVWCSAGGVVTSQTCTFVPKVKIYPKDGTGTYPTTVKFILFGATPLGTDTVFSSVFWPASSPNTPKAPARLTYQFPNNGIYTVWMIVSNSGQSCQNDTVKKVVSILTYQSVIQLSPFNAPTVKCKSNATWTIDGLSTTPNAPYPPSITYDWGDGTDTIFTTLGNTNTNGGLLQPISHNYDTCGTFRVKLIISNSSGSCKDSSDLLLTVSEIYQDSTTSSNPRHNLDLIQLSPVYGSCNYCSKFTSKIATCGSTLKRTIINFNDGSKKDTILGTWTSFVHCFLKQPPNIQYIVEDINGCTITDYLSTPVFCGNKANFIGLPDTVLCLGTPLTFLNRSSGVITTNVWTWDTISCKSGSPIQTLTTPSKSANFNPTTVTTNGYYYLNLNVSNFCSGTATTCESDTCIRVHFQDPIADFDIPDTFPCPSSFLPVINNSYGAYDSVWIEEQIPGVAYLHFTYSKSHGGIPNTIYLPTGAVGNYYIIIKIFSKKTSTTSLVCSDTYSQPVTVKGPKGKLLPPFKQHACVGETLYFSDSTNSANGILAIWCDGIDIIPHNTTEYYHFGHTFTCVGAYPVMFFITDGSNCSYPLVDTVFIDGPDAQFNMSPNLSNFCGTASFQLQNASTASTVSDLDTLGYEYILYDANTSLPVDTFKTDTANIILSTPGTYSIKFKVKSKFGCVDSIEKLSLFTIHPKPTSSFVSSNDSICITQCVSFTNTSTDPEPNLSYHWYFDWPSKLLNSTAASPNYCYYAAGSFNVALIDSSTTFCVDTSILKVINVSPDVVAKFTASSTILCGDSVLVKFTNSSSSYNGITYCWNFGDGATGCESNSKNPSHMYHLQSGANSNCYYVSLKVTNRSGCDSTITDTICIYPKPNAGFTVTPSGQCNPLTVTFIDQSSTTGLSPITNYNIKWGQGANYNSINFPTGVTKQYSHPGMVNVYQDTIIYIITTQQGCMDTAIDYVNTFPIPIACVANDTIVCAGQQVNLGCFAYPNHTYNWFKPFGTTYTPDRYSANPYIKPMIDTTYHMQVSNQYGCSNIDSIHVGIIPYIVPYAGRDTAICIGGTALLFAQGGNTYSWVNKKTQELITTSSAFTVSPPFPSNFVYTATITGTCNTDVIDVQVTVFPSPNIILNPDINDVVAGHPVRIPQVGASGGFYTYLWNPNYNIDSITSGSPTVWPEITTTYQVILTDIHGCYDSAEVTVHVLCNASNAIYVPNAFLPDANGINGRFFLQGKGIKQLNYLRIYDRWGGLVYSVEHSPINEPSVGWDGTFNGAAMPSGVFMYQTEVQCAEGEVFPMTGTFTLIR